MRKVLREVLTSAGYHVVGEAANGRKVVELYWELRPDLVTLDLVLPEMGGIDAAREIVRLDPDARILMCSAIGQKPLIAEAMAAGAREFVVKPFPPARVLEAARRALG
ncbi:MAG: response regulator [Gemmatimonas sp.]|nr:response regulator [Gemmatimonas sp.]